MALTPLPLSLARLFRRDVLEPLTHSYDSALQCDGSPGFISTSYAKCIGEAHWGVHIDSSRVPHDAAEARGDVDVGVTG
jgi:hypothetical protein